MVKTLSVRIICVNTVVLKVFRMNVLRTWYMYEKNTNGIIMQLLFYEFDAN